MRCMFVLLLCLCGCQGFMQNDAKVMFTFGTTFTVEQVGPKDVESKSVIGLDFMDWTKKPLVEWVLENQQSPTQEIIDELEGE